MAEGLLLMMGEVKRGYAALMPMRSPELPGMTHQAQLSDGIGWLPRLLAQAMKNNLPSPLDMPLDQLFILSAAAAANDGKECAGADYRDREISAPGELQSAPVAEQPGKESPHDGGGKQEDRNRPHESSSHPAMGEMVDAGNKEIHLGTNPHDSNVA